MAAITRPLSLGEILDRTVQLYRRNFLLLAGISVPPAACIVAISGVASIFLSNRALALAGAGRVGAAGHPTPPDPTQLMVIGLVAIAFFFIGLPIILGVFAIAFSALNFAACQVNRGDPATIRASYGYAFGHFWRHIGILFLQSLFAGIIPYFVLTVLVVFAAGMAAALSVGSGAGNWMMPLLVVLLAVVVLVWVVGSVLIWLRLSLAYPISVAENQRAWPSLVRSNRLSKGSRGRIFVLFLLIFVLTITLSLGLTVPIDIVLGLSSLKRFGNHADLASLNLIQVANLAASFLVRVFVMPIYAIALVLFYVDQRTRLEGYDIEQLMINAGWSALPSNSSPTTAPLIPPASIEAASLEPGSPKPQPEGFEP